MDELTRDHGPQPLDGLMFRWNITNHELVEVSPEQLNHKQVQKARKGRQLTLHLMQKLMRALNDTVVAKLPKEQKATFVPYLHKHLHSYFLQFSLRGLRKDRDGWVTATASVPQGKGSASPKHSWRSASESRREPLFTWEANIHRPSGSMARKLADLVGVELFVADCQQRNA